MRLLILTPEYDGSGGGIMTFYQALVPALQNAGASVRVIEGSAFHSASDNSVRWPNGTRVETLEQDRLHRWHARFGHLSATPGLRRYLAAAWAMWEQAGFGEDVDIVEACDWGLLFVPPAMDAARPLLVQCHGSAGQISEHDPMTGEETQDTLIRLLERMILSEVDALQTSSCTNALYWRENTRRNVSSILPAWAEPLTEPVQTLSGRGLVLGRLQRWKGPQVLCDALEFLGRRAPVIDWIGRDTPWGTRNGSTADHLSCAYPDIWAKRIVHHRPVAAAEAHRRQACALFNVVPSTWDVFNFTAVEAMASGRPAIVSTGAGAGELIEDGVNGYVFPAGDAETLAAKIDRILSEGHDRHAEIGRAARETIRHALDPATIAAQRLAVYHATIDRFRSDKAPSCSPFGEICRPKDCPAVDDGAFLEQVPLRTLVRHVIKRSGKKAHLSARAGVAK